MFARLSWYRRRLAAMSVAEIANRSHRTLVHLADDALFRISPRRWRSTWYPAPGRVFGARPLSSPVGFLRVGQGAGLATRFPADTELLVMRAEHALARRVQFFGYPPVVLDEDVAADVDPYSGRAWPARHGKSVDYRHATVGDPKWIWELNRCQDLSLLAAAWLASGEDRFGRAAADRLVAWIQAHPPGRGIAWSSGFEAGIRGVSLALTVDALRGSTFLLDAQLEVALMSLWQHGRWIRRDPSLGSSANNHRIGELAGLVVIGSLAPELRDAWKWRAEALDELATEVVLQIRPDGTSAEQAFSYHLFVLDLLLVVTAVLDARQELVSEAVASAINRSGDALWAQLGVAELPPTYGDTDDARAFVVDGDDRRGARDVAAAIAARFDHPKAKRASEGADATAWWLFGAPGVERLERTTPARWPESVTLPDAGLTIMRRKGVRTMFDHGPHGHASLAAHAHADALRVDVSVGSEASIVDPGVGSYFARPDLRDAFRGTAFHATVTVDGLDSSVAAGPFLWTEHARSRLLMADLRRGFAVAEHDGYARLPDPVSHRRALFVLPQGGVVVVDRLVAQESHHYSQNWPLHPDLEVESCSSHRIVARRDRGGVVLEAASPIPLGANATRGQLDPPIGWWSERLESAVPSWHVALHLDGRGAVDIATAVVPFTAEPPEVRLEIDPPAARVVLVIDGTGWSERLELDSRPLHYLFRGPIRLGVIR